MYALCNQTRLAFKGIIRDRILLAILSVAFFIILLVPAFSSFSMRQVQELSITLGLSAISLVLLVISTLMGATSVWRDVERRYTASFLALPIPRASYLLGKFCAISLFIVICACLLGMASALVIVISSAGYPSAIPINWLNIVLALAAECMKFIMLTAFAMLFSSIGTSFSLPFFGALAIYFAGSASQEVFDYVGGSYGQKIPPVSLAIIKGAYYLLPNFSAFNLKTQAIYGLPVAGGGLAYVVCYFLLYTAILLSIAIFAFSRRQLS